MTPEEDLDLFFWATQGGGGLCSLPNTYQETTLVPGMPPRLPLIPAARTAIQSPTCLGRLWGWQEDQGNLPQEGE